MNYPGGKNAGGTWQWLAGLMPMHVRYAEPFAGSFAIGRRKAPALESVAIDRDAAVCEWLRRLDMPGLAVRRGCGIKWLEYSLDTLDEDWLVYLDPPYLPATRVKKKIYRYELTERDHRRLLAVVQQLRCPVMLSGYDHALYRRQLADWQRHERRVTTRGSPRTEVVWCNFEPPGSAHACAGDAAWRLPVAGRNFRERERIKRLARRWRANFVRRPESERQIILATLLSAEQAAALDRDAAK